MPWINTDTINAMKFRRGYKPQDYHDIISYAKDGQFMFPRCIQTIDFNFHDKPEMLSFYNNHYNRFNLSNYHPVNNMKCYAYLPGPGEVRPSSIVLRHDVYQGAEPNNRVVLKIVDTKHGYHEYKRQMKLHDLGYPSPEPYIYMNYLSLLQILLKEKRASYKIPLIPAILSFLHEIEIKKRPFNELKSKETRAKISVLLHKLKVVSSLYEISLIERYLDDLINIDEGIFDDLEFKGFLFMEFIEHTVSFENILFDILGGKEMEHYSGASRILPSRPYYDEDFLMNDIISLILKLWNLGECHNDMKGEHFLYNFHEKQWYVIDFGELVSPGGLGQDLAVFIADSNSFVYDRCKFNLKLGKKNGMSTNALEKMEENIILRNSRFWDIFLEKLCSHISTTTVHDAYRILKKRNLSFQASKLEPYS